MTAPPPRRPWWRRKRTWAAGALALAAAYPASLGPVAYAVGHYWLPPEAFGLTAPLRYLSGDDDGRDGRLARAYWGYIGDCYAAGIEDAGTVTVYRDAEADAVERAIEKESARRAAPD